MDPCTPSPTDMDVDAECGRTNDKGPHRSRSVTFSDRAPDVMMTEKWPVCGISDASVSEGKYLIRALRHKYPGLPKFAYFDEERDAAMAEQAANLAREHVMKNMPESSQLEAAINSSGSRRMSLLVPGNPVNLLAAAAAAASATATASSKRDQAAQLCGDDSSSVSAEAENSGNNGSAMLTPDGTAEATLQKTANAGFRWLSRTTVLSRRSSGDIPMHMRLQRFDSLHDARLRFGAVCAR